MEVSGKFHGLATLPQVEAPRYQLNRRLGVLQRWSGSGNEGKNPSTFLAGTRTPVVQPIA